MTLSTQFKREANRMLRLAIKVQQSDTYTDDVKAAIKSQLATARKGPNRRRRRVRPLTRRHFPVRTSQPSKALVRADRNTQPKEAIMTDTTATDSEAAAIADFDSKAATVAEVARKIADTATAPDTFHEALDAYAELAVVIMQAESAHNLALARLR